MTPSVLLPLVGLLVLGLVSSETVDPSLEDLTNRNTDFAGQLYRAVASRTDDNVFLSTLVVSTALSALLSTTSGMTQNQLLQGLSLAGLDPQALPGRSGLRGNFRLRLQTEVTVRLCCPQTCFRT